MSICYQNPAPIGPYLLPETVGEEVADAAAEALSLSFTLPQYSTLTYCIFTK